MKYEDKPIEIGNIVSVLWNQLDNGYEFWEKGTVTEINSAGFYLKMIKTGGKVFVNYSSKLWKKG